MSRDDLSKPLGVTRQTAPSRLPVSAGQAVLGASALAAVAVAGFILLKGDPLGGEPHAVARIERQALPSRTEPPAAPTEPAKTDPAKTRETASEMEDAAGVKVVRGRGGGAPGAVVIHVPDAPARAATTKLAAIDRKLSEKGRHGPLPRIAADGARPSEVYARPFDASAAMGKPKIAVLLTGLGIGATVTAEATAKLPGEVSFAFAPYGGDLEKMTARARDEGHEVLLQLPMEPFGYPDNDPGPQTLLADAAEAQNIDRLHWLMGRFQGYAGLTNFMGARLAGSPKALRPILVEASKRGLMFIDDGAGGRSQIGPLAAETGLPAVRADVVLEGLDKAADYDAALARAEQMARASGQALVIAPALPANIERLSRWLKGLGAKGFVLAPASALLSPKKA